MGQLIDDLLNLSRLSRAELRRQSVSLTALAAEAARQLQEANPGRGVECRIAEGMLVEGDLGLLRVVVWNLLENAWKFTGRNEGAVVEFGIVEGGPGAGGRAQGEKLKWGKLKAEIWKAES